MQDQPQDKPNDSTSWQYTPEPADNKPGPAPSAKSINWTASEFIAHQKSAGWYGLLALAGLGAAGFIYLLTRDLISGIVIIIVVIMLAVMAGRKPRTLEYSIDSSGVHIGQRTFPYGEIKSFSVIEEDPFSSISLTPLGRLKPLVSIYYDPKDEDQIVSILSSYLPHKESQKDPIDRFLHKIRF